MPRLLVMEDSQKREGGIRAGQGKGNRRRLERAQSREGRGRRLPAGSQQCLNRLSAREGRRQRCALQKPQLPVRLPRDAAPAALGATQPWDTWAGITADSGSPNAEGRFKSAPNKRVVGGWALPCRGLVTPNGTLPSARDELPSKRRTAVA